MASDDDMDMDEMSTQQRAPVRRATANQPVRSAKGKGKQPLVSPIKRVLLM